ncbi:3'(2'),5'-bisphosphate nucleotidase CysQ [Bosea sp. 117]|uniref:3'(2'),5'-bisphosphate nucleotidase CysQ n=1 Tax=Bosea sp. 117 TaxID=1125973 RepID=UPI00068A7CCD|nr:3'(2'),5'-bisphosphate nucleotidase CysQ [Bosea sp. 117]
MSIPIAVGPELLRLAELSIRAGEVILDIYASDFTVTRKADCSPVTEADQRAEAIILEGLREIAPDLPVIAEEEAAAGRLPEIGSRFFLVDPLDGTREFLARNGEFTVNIARIEDGVAVAGVVYAPALGVLYAGAAGTAFKARIADGALTDIRPIAVRHAPEAIVAIGSRSHGSSETAAWLARYGEVSFTSAGSSLKFCLVAEGAADIYPRLGRTMEWDTAAGDAVLRAAGGIVTRLDGRPLLYGKSVQSEDAPFANPHFVAFGDRRLLAAASGALSTAPA